MTEEKMRVGTVKRFVSRNRDKVWFSFALNTLALAFFFLLMSPFYETNDDTTMRELVNGARMYPSTHLLFEHYFLDAIYRLLYLLPGRLPWYTIVQYAVLLFSFTAATYVVLRKLEGPAGFLAVSILLIYFGKECYIRVQFTKTAGIAICAGILLLFYAAESAESGKRIPRAAVVCGVLLGGLGAMYRFKQAIACAALMTGIGLFCLLKAARENRHSVLRSFWPYLKVFLLFGSCILVLYGTDRYSYRMSPRWQEYEIYNDRRSDLLDYGMPDYYGNEETYRELGLNYEAYRLCVGWNFNDPDVFDTETIEKLLELQPPRRVSLALARNFLKEFPARYFQTYTFYAFLLLGVLWIFCGYHRREDMLAVLYEVVFFGLLYFYLYFAGRYAVNRVDTGFWFALALTAVWFLDAGKLKLSGQLAGVLCLSLLILSQNNWKDDWRIYHTGDEGARRNQRVLIEEIAQDQEHLYVMKRALMSSFTAYGIFTEMPEGVLNNVCLLGGWDCYVPEIRDITETYRVTNPYRDLVDNPSVYIVDDDIELTLSYLRAYYAPDAQAVQIKELHGRKVYQIVTEKAG